MKVAFAYRRIGRGAAVPNYCFTLAAGFCEDWETWAFTRQIDPAPPSLRVVHFPFAFRSKRLEYGPNSVLNALFVRAYRSRERYDIVHTQDGESLGGDVVTAHALLRVLYRVFRKYDPQHVAWLPRSPLLWAEDFVYGSHRFRRVIACSEKTRDALGEVYGIPHDDISLVRLGVDSDFFKPDAAARTRFRNEHGLSLDATILLHVSTDFERKGLRTILQCVPLLPDDAALVVAGRGAESYFRDLATRLGISDRVTYLGYRPDLEEIYPAADVFVFPTRFDFFGYPVLEAMACGVPPVVTHDAGVAEVIRDGMDGVLLRNPDDPRELADAVRLATADGTGRQMGREARFVAEDLSSEAMVLQTKAVHEELSRR